MAQIVARQYIHSCYKDKLPTGGDAVIVKENVFYDDDSIVPELRIVQNPKRTFMITKPGLRTHEDKKEWEDLSAVDTYTVHNHEMENKIHEVLYGYVPKKKIFLRELCSSPYVYGADIHIETLIKARMKQVFDKTGKVERPVTTGFYDIEASVLEDNEGEIIMISVSHETKMFTAILKKNFFVLDENGCKQPGNLDDLIALSKKTLKTHIDKYKFTFEYYVGDTVLEVITWIFDRIHENKTDFLGVWNIGYDIPTTMKAIKQAGKDPKNIMCPKIVPEEMRRIDFKEDNRMVDHFTRKWHWVSSTGYSQWYDAMCLYSILRTVDGFEIRYKLDYILKKNKIGTGKLKFSNIIKDSEHMSDKDWHRYMQTKHPYEYIVYNQFDVMSLQIMNWVTQDAQSMYTLSGISLLSNYVRQTRRGSDTLYYECLSRNKVLASPGPSMVTEYDALLGKVGGAVLPPERTDYIGIKVFEDFPDKTTMMHILGNDIDFSGMYPNVTMGGNISKETKRSTMLTIEGFDRVQSQMLYSLLVSPHENAVQIGKTYFNLPGYQEMDRMFAEHIHLE